MALTKCKECKKEVSTNAKACPHCGISDPGNKPGEFVMGLIGVIVIGFLLVRCTGDDDNPQDKNQVAEKQAVDDATCKTDLSCWGEKHSIAAGVRCDDLVEKLANFSFRWTDGTFEPKFSHYRWLKLDAATVTYLGDKIEFQNGFGAYQRHVYECDYDPATETVLDVRAFPGHL